MRSNPRIAPVLILLCLMGSLPGCAWVSLAPEAEQVRVAPSLDAVDECKKLGAVQAQTRSRIGFIARSQKKIGEELKTLARNNAAEMGANVVVADGPPSVDGRQRFLAFRCSR